eukprot:6492719-Amphidinium_carterae.5
MFKIARTRTAGQFGQTSMQSDEPMVDMRGLRSQMETCSVAGTHTIESRRHADWASQRANVQEHPQELSTVGHVNHRRGGRQGSLSRIASICYLGALARTGSNGGELAPCTSSKCANSSKHWLFDNAQVTPLTEQTGPGTQEVIMMELNSGEKGVVMPLLVADRIMSTQEAKYKSPIISDVYTGAEYPSTLMTDVPTGTFKTQPRDFHQGVCPNTCAQATGSTGCSTERRVLGTSQTKRCMGYQRRNATTQAAVTLLS